MGLNKEAIDNSIVLLRDYDDIIVNKRFIREFLSIIGDSREETIGYHFINSKSNPASLDSKDMCIYIDPVYMPYSVESNIRLFQKLYPEIDETFLRNFFAVGTILHEIYHLDQVKMAYANASSYEEIGRLYRIFYDTMDRSFLNRLKYNVNPGSFFHERNAWIMSSIDLANIYRYTALEPIATNIYLASIMEGYEKSTCPVKKTLNKIGLPYGFDLRGIPFIELLYNGFMVDVDKYNQVIDFIGNTPVEKLHVEEIDKKIRSLR